MRPGSMPAAEMKLTTDVAICRRYCTVDINELTCVHAFVRPD